MFYERKIRYLDYLENKERVRGVGFAKIELRDCLCELDIQVSGMHITDNFTRKLLLVGEDKEAALCEIVLERGRGSVYISGLDSLNLGNLGISYEELCGIRIPIAAGKEIYCVVREGERRLEAVEQPESEKRLEAVEQLQEVVQTEDQRKEELRIQPASEEVAVEEPEEEIVEEQDIIAQNIEEFVNKALQARETDGEKLPPFNKGLQESKWRQLESIYPHIKPFRDERDYLSIGPGDFVILTEKYYGMANNSFLLHGYYNYKHLILSRLEKRGNATYYIGVPGNFYEREKQVALLFGFESFECAEEPARAGDYGYYMMRVEL